MPFPRFGELPTGRPASGHHCPACAFRCSRRIAEDVRCAKSGIARVAKLLRSSGEPLDADEHDGGVLGGCTRRHPPGPTRRPSPTRTARRPSPAWPPPRPTCARRCARRWALRRFAASAAIAAPDASALVPLRRLRRFGRFGRAGPVLMGHDRAAVAAVFGVLASGHPVLVLDPLTQAAAAHVRRGAPGVRACLSDPTARTRPRGGRVVVPRETIRPRASAATSGPPTGPPLPRLVGFKSGSTGRPKLVLVDHAIPVSARG